MQAMSGSNHITDSKRSARSGATSRAITAYTFLAPAMILLLVFSFWPVGYGTYLAFTHYNVIDSAQWVGLDNFRDLLADGLFRSALWNSLLYLLVVPVIQLVAIVLAVLVNNQLPGIKFFRAVFYVPVVTTVTVVGVIWNFMFSEEGALNAALRWLHLVNQPIGFLTDDRIALFAVMFVTIWRGIGWYMVLYLAGLQSLSPEVEEAAVLDGANRWKRFWFIALPQMRPTILLCSLMSVLAAIKAFEEVQVMTQGGPAQSTYTALYYAYDFGIRSLDFGHALAASLIASIVCGVLAWVNFRYLQPRSA